MDGDDHATQPPPPLGIDPDQLEPELQAVISFTPGGSLLASVPAMSQRMVVLQLQCERDTDGWRDRASALGTHAARRTLLARLAWWLQSTAGARGAEGSGMADSPPPADLLRGISILTFHCSIARRPAGAHDVLESGLALQLMQPITRYFGGYDVRLLAGAARLCSTLGQVASNVPSEADEVTARAIATFCCRAFALHFEGVPGVHPQLPAEAHNALVALRASRPLCVARAAVAALKTDAFSAGAAEVLGAIARDSIVSPPVAAACASEGLLEAIIDAAEEWPNDAGAQEQVR